MGSYVGFLIMIIRLNIHISRLLLNIVWYRSNTACEFTQSEIENMYRECYLILSSDTGRFEDLFNLDEVPVTNSPLMIEAQQDDRIESIQLEEMSYSYCSGFTIPPVSLKCPVDIFDDSDYELTIPGNRKRRASSNFNSTNMSTSDFPIDTSESNKKSKTNTNDEEIVNSKHQCQSETSFADFVIINTNDSFNIACESENSTFLNDPQTICSIKSPINATQEYVCKLKVKDNTRVITQGESSNNFQELVLEKKTMFSIDTEPIETDSYVINDNKQIKTSNTEFKLANLPEGVVFIPHISDENYIIFPNKDLIYDIKFSIDYRKKGIVGRIYTPEQKLNENFYRPKITILNGINGENEYKMSFVIENIPRCLRPIFLKELVTKGHNIEFASQKNVFLYKIYMTFTFSCDDKVKLIDVIPYLAYNNLQNIWNDHYVTTILNWRYKIKTNCHSGNNFKNEKNKVVNITRGGEKNVLKRIRCFLGLKKFHFNHIKVRSLVKNSIIKEILNKLSIFHTHLVYLNSEIQSPDQLKAAIDAIDNVRKQFLTGELSIEEGSILNETENEILSVYERIYPNFERLSSAILNAYELYV